jgi:ferredoxin
VKIIVDRKRCMRHGQCTIAAPDLFRFDADGELQFEEQPGEDKRMLAEDAADACPEQAISIAD